MIARSVTRLNCDSRPYTLILDDGHEIPARTIVLATGAQYNKPALPNIDASSGRGIYYNATFMEAQLCVGEQIIVIGGGNSAGHGGSGSSRANGAWVRLVDDLIATLTNRVRHKSTEHPDDDDTEEDATSKVREKRKAAEEAARRKVVRDVPYLVDRIEDADPGRVNLPLTLALLEHAAPVVAVEPAQLRSHFARVIGVAARREIWLGNQSLVQAAYLLYGSQLRAAGDPGVVLRMRRLLLRCGSALDRTAVPNLSQLKNLTEALATSDAADDLWREVCDARTPLQACAFLLAHPIAGATLGQI